MRESLKRKLDYSIDLLRKAERMALRLDPENGFWLAFSGGKDSQALYHVARLAGVRFKAHMNLTSVDPPEVIRFVKENYPDVELIKPKMRITDRKNAEFGFNWWISGKSFDEFYADDVLQQKIDFDV